MSKIIKCVSLHGKPLIVTTPQQGIVKERADESRETFASHENSMLVVSQEKADVILREAAEEAARCISQANDMIDTIKREAHQEGLNAGYSQGLEEGFAAGLQQAQAQIEKALLQSTEIIENTEKRASDMINAAERQIIEIALCIARKILKREIDENPMTILPIVKEALGKTQDGDSITIRVNPEDTDLLHHAKRDLQQVVGGDKILSIMADHTVNSGGCMIDTKSGTIDASIDTQFETIRQTLQDVLP